MAEIKIRIPNEKLPQVVSAIGSAVGIEKPTKADVRAHLIKHIRDIVKQEARRAASQLTESKIKFTNNWGDLEEKDEG